MIETIISYIQKEFAHDQQVIGPEDDLLLSGLIDSVGVMKLVAFLEQTYNKPIPPQEITIEHFENIQAIVDYISSK